MAIGTDHSCKRLIAVILSRVEGRLTFERQRSVRANQHRNGTGTTGWSPTSLSVDSNITTDDNSITTIPRRTLNPVDGVKKGSSASIASILRVNTFDIGVAGCSEELHENGFSGLGFVNDSFRSDINPTNALRVNVVLFEKVGDGYTCRKFYQKLGKGDLSAGAYRSKKMN